MTGDLVRMTVEGEANKRVDANGHALCGCGGSAQAYHREGGTECCVECPKCYIGTCDWDSEAEAWAAWDKAMGVKGNG